MGHTINVFFSTRFLGGHMLNYEKHLQLPELLNCQLTVHISMDKTQYVQVQPDIPVGVKVSAKATGSSTMACFFS